MCLVAGIALALALAGTANPSATAARHGGGASLAGDALSEARAWLRRFANAKALDPESAAQAQRTVTQLTAQLSEGIEQRSELFAVLADFAALVPRRPASGAATDPYLGAREQIAGEAFRGLERALELYSAERLETWIATDVLGNPKAHASGRRRATLEVLAGKYEPTTLVAILACSRELDPEIRERTLRALVGWDDVGVHAWMLEQLRTPSAVPAWTVASIVQAHFGGLELPQGSASSRAVYDFVHADLVSGDWRVATRALRLIAAVDDSLAAPALIEALRTWIARRTSGGGSRRIEGELVNALRARSGVNIGASPDAWRAWWAARGTAPVAPRSDEQRAESRAAFFGLRPVSDRVTFLLDRSGSMAANFEGQGTRYREAIRQMSAFLESLGPGTRFRVLLFESDVHIWKDKLQDATPENLRLAQTWAAERRPDGGTQLRPAVEQILRLGSGGEVDLKRLEEDTVVVLCDGATEEGPSWVAPLLERIGPECCVAFYCVQLGSGGDGALQQLAELSGGQFVACDG